MSALDAQVKYVWYFLLQESFLPNCCNPFVNFAGTFLGQTPRTTPVYLFRWVFLEDVQKTGCPLPREAIARRCARDYGLLRFLCMSARRSSSMASEDMSPVAVASSATTSGRAKLYSFYAAVVVEALGLLGSTNEALLRALVPDVIHGLSVTRSPEYQVRNDG